MTAPKFSNQYDHHQGPELNEFEPTRTKQEFLKESDINNVIASYALTGIAPAGFTDQPIYGDVSGMLTYHEALNFIHDAQARFQELPAKLRERFANDPGKLLDFLADDNNLDEARKLGLVNEAPKAPEPPVTPPVKP